MSASTVQLNEQQLDEKLAQLERERTWSPRLISKLEAFISSAADEDLLRINPIQFCQERSLNETEVVDLFLVATKAGLFTMDWHIICPHCGFIIDSLPRMKQVHSHHICPTCGAERDYCLDDYIQVAFTISEVVRKIRYHHPESLEIDDLYLHYRLSKEVISPLPEIPSWRAVIAHITTYLGYIQAGETVSVALELPPGVLRATDSRACIQLCGTPAADDQTHVVPIQVARGRFHSSDPILQPRNQTRLSATNEPVQFRHELARDIPSGKVVIEIENQESTRCPLFIYNPGEAPTPVLELQPGLNGKRLLSNQSFRDLFRSEVVCQSETLAIKDITFLFTDLKSSTSLYDQIGDTNAYFLVLQHFDTLKRVIRNHNGAIVKTIGDAVMATFDNPIQATDASLAMIKALSDFNSLSSQNLRLKIGIHRGHAMAVTLNDVIDYFGQNVNIAARVQALANSNQIIVSSDVYETAGVSESLAQLRVDIEEVQVKIGRAHV